MKSNQAQNVSISWDKKGKTADPPDILLILGTDAAGKNHVANFIVEMLEADGHEVEKRDGWFSAEPSDVVTSEDKGWFSLLKERIFLLLFPFIRFLMPPLLGFLLWLDMKRFRNAPGKVIVISHTALRVLAFYLGHVFNHESEIRMPPYLTRILQSVRSATHARTIVLDIDDEIRKQRIAARTGVGKVDYFDRYMAADSLRSERIEAFLVWLSVRFLHGAVIVNDDLDYSELEAEVKNAFTVFHRTGRNNL